MHGKTAYFSELLKGFSIETNSGSHNGKIIDGASFRTTICVILRILHVLSDTSSVAPILTKLRPSHTPGLKFQQAQRFFWNAPQREVCQMEALDGGFGHLRRF
jgi:hypothetical protein